MVAPTAVPMANPLTLPALATFDDGTGDWLASSHWALQVHDNGLAWVMTSTALNPIEGGNVATDLPTLTLQPTEMPTEVVLSTDAPTLTLQPTEMPPQ